MCFNCEMVQTATTYAVEFNHTLCPHYQSITVINCVYNDMTVKLCNLSIAVSLQISVKNYTDLFHIYNIFHLYCSFLRVMKKKELCVKTSNHRRHGVFFFVFFLMDIILLRANFRRLRYFFYSLIYPCSPVTAN